MVKMETNLCKYTFLLIKFQLIEEHELIYKEN